MNIKTILNLLAKKYPEGGDNGWLGAMLIFYDDGGGYIRRTRRHSESEDNRDYMSNRLFDFSNLDQLIKHLKEK